MCVCHTAGPLSASNCSLISPLPFLPNERLTILALLRPSSRTLSRCRYRLPAAAGKKIISNKERKRSSACERSRGCSGNWLPSLQKTGRQTARAEERDEGARSGLSLHKSQVYTRAGRLPPPALFVFVVGSLIFMCRQEAEREDRETDRQMARQKTPCFPK